MKKATFLLIVFILFGGCDPYFDDVHTPDEESQMMIDESIRFVEENQDLLQIALEAEFAEQEVPLTITAAQIAEKFRSATILCGNNHDEIVAGDADSGQKLLTVDGKVQWVTDPIIFECEGDFWTSALEQYQNGSQIEGLTQEEMDACIEDGIVSACPTLMEINDYYEGLQTVVSVGTHEAGHLLGLEHTFTPEELAEDESLKYHDGAYAISRGASWTTNEVRSTEDFCAIAYLNGCDECDLF